MFRPASSRSKPKHSHTLRYVLRNRATDDTYLVIVFTLHLKEDVNEDGSLKPAALSAMKEAGKVSTETKDVNKDEDYQEARKHFEKLNVDEGPGVQEDDGGVD